MKTQRILTTSLRIILFLLIAAAGATVLFNRTLRSPKMIALPEEAAGLALTRSLSGQEAAAQFNSIHGEDFTLTSAQVGYYGADETIVIRAGGTPFAGATTEMMAIITGNLNGATGTLSPVSERRDRGRTIYMLTDEADQIHFYFQSERYLVWLSGPSEQAEAALKQALVYFP